MTLREGFKRQVSETGERIGLPVAKIIRVRIGSLRLVNLKARKPPYIKLGKIGGLTGYPGRVFKVVEMKNMRQRN